MICPECEEIVADDYSFHTTCCPHDPDRVEVTDEADSHSDNAPAHDWRPYCHDCGAEVTIVGDKSDWWYEAVA